MTDEERKNRNPAPEVDTFRYEDCPELHIGDLELNHVYILQGSGFVASWNYIGKVRITNPVTLDVATIYRFHGPRVNLTVGLMGMPDGTLQDGSGQKITLRRYSGPDA